MSALLDAKAPWVSVERTLFLRTEKISGKIGDRCLCVCNYFGISTEANE